MPSVLITAFEPYDRAENASWLCLLELTQELPAKPTIFTRRYPVDFSVAQERLLADLKSNYDFALHLGQAPGASQVQLESMAVNVRGEPGQRPENYGALVDGGPAAYRTALPLGRWAAKIRGLGIPAGVSFHAGTYLCNGVYYWSQHYAAQLGLKTQAAFLHLPLATSQVLAEGTAQPSLPSAACAAAVRCVLEELA